MDLNILSKQYINFLPCSERNVKIIEHYFDLTRVLSSDQKKLLKSVVVNNETKFYKNRGIGATTAIDAFLSVEAFMAEEPINIVIMCPYMTMCEEHFRNFTRFLTQIPSSLNDAFDDEKIFKVCTTSRIVLKNGSKIFFETTRSDRLRAINVDYMVFDDCNIVDNSILAYAKCKKGKIISINTDFEDLHK